MLLDRGEFISALFRETDRAQRTKTSLSLIQIGIEQSPSPSPNKFDPSADEIVVRITGLLRSYDIIGEFGRGMYLVALPGCDGTYAALLAERLKAKAFRVPARDGEQLALGGACFGVVSSGGRSPLVVMHEAEAALQRARANGPGSIEFATEATGARHSADKGSSADVDSRNSWNTSFESRRP